MAKGSSKPGKVRLTKITAKQRAARQRNIVIARKAKKAGPRSRELYHYHRKEAMKLVKLVAME